MEYQIEGAPLPVVICQLEAGETMLTERGSMSWMTPNMKVWGRRLGGCSPATPFSRTATPPRAAKD